MNRTSRTGAAILSLLASGSAAAQPLAPCLTTPEAEALVITAVPALVTSLAVVCAPALPPSALLRQPDNPYGARYVAAGDAAWPTAKTGLAKIAGPDMQPLLESDLARPMISAMAGPLVAKDFKPADCAPTDRLLTALAPLTPRQAATAFVALFQLADGGRKIDDRKKSALPLCPLGRK
ncbi:hypothetical protein [uncultured Sphingomonas sp.]|uniref:hypothetical protein n=1 Tax=uncultured Sphingomonas sp. TaxID=158754 RepID=UPI0035CBD196